MNQEVPASITRLIDAVNRGDTAAFLALFAPDGQVDDWGKKYIGHRAIRRWSEREFTGAQGTLSPHRIAVQGESVVVDAGWKSGFYSGDSRFIFTLRGRSIVEMRIESL